MGLEKRTIVIGISVTLLIIIGVVLGLVLGLRSVTDTSGTELEAWPRAADGSALISFNASDLKSYQQYYKSIRVNFRGYSRYIEVNGVVQPNDHRVPCNYSTALALTEKQVCDVSIEDDFYPCVKQTNFNYGNGTPCVFLTLNKVLNWAPRPYNTSEDLPTTMPEDLKAHIKSLVGRPEANEVWVSCEGEGPADRQHMGRLKYLPARGFPAYFFPYTRKKDYLNPLVAVMFQNPTKGVLINVVCKAWARNIATCASGAACEPNATCAGAACEPSATARFQLKVEE